MSKHIKKVCIHEDTHYWKGIPTYVEKVYLIPLLLIYVEKKIEWGNLNLQIKLVNLRKPNGLFFPLPQKVRKLTAPRSL